MSNAQQDAMYTEAMHALQAGDRARARDLLTRLLKTGSNNPTYWIWMSAVVETSKERTFCLKEALRLDPQNGAARRGLAFFGVLPVDDAQALPGRLQKRNWQAKLAEIQALEQSPAKTLPRAQMILLGVSLLVVFGLVGFAIWGFQRLNRPDRSQSAMIFPTYTAVRSTIIRPTETAFNSTPGAPQPLWMRLKATYTPTPIYVNTPHALTEAYRIGMRAFERADWTGAITYFQQVLEIDPNAVDVIYAIGEAYRQQGNTTQALKFYQQAIQKSPGFAPAYVGRARAALVAKPKNLDPIRKDLQTAIQNDPRFVDAYIEKAALQIQSNTPEDALRTLDQADALQPDSAFISLYRAQAYLRMGDTQHALEEARRANQMDITLLDAYRILGETLQVQGDLPASIDPLQTYLFYQPEDAQAWAWLAKAQYAQHLPDKALDSITQSLRRDTQQGEAYLLRAQIRYEQGSAEDALADYKAALRFTPDSFDASMGIGLALMSLNYPGDAYTQFERSKGLAETDAQMAEFLFWRAQSLERLAQPEAALRDWLALQALPTGAVTDEILRAAGEHVHRLQTPTPTPKLKSSPTPTQTPTRKSPVLTKTATPKR